MKRTTITVLVLLLAYAAMGQKKINISGKIKDPVDNKMIVVNVTNTGLAGEPKQEQLTLDTGGNFSITLPVKETYNWIIVVHANKRIDFIAEAGSNLVLSAQGPSFDTSFHFGGKGKEIPEFFGAYLRQRGGIMGFLRKIQEVAVVEPDKYASAIDTFRKEEISFLEQNNKNLPKSFSSYWKDCLRYATYDAQLNYPSIHEMIKQKSNNIQQIPVENFSEIKNVPLSLDDRYLGQSFYQSYATNYYPALLNAEGFTNNVSVDPATNKENRSQALQQTDSVLHLLYRNAPPRTAELVTGRILIAGAKSWTLPELEARIAEYKKHYPKSGELKILDEMAYEIKKFNPGQPAVDFSFKTLEGKEMKLSDLKGKVVYMDFWASWCGPCKGEMPHAKKLKEQFKDKDVVFLYVSIDDKEEAWKKGIQAMDISGIHTRTAGWGGPIAKLYKIQSVPAYFLIDKKGNFALKNTPRPSQSAELAREIENLLQ